MSGGRNVASPEDLKEKIRGAVVALATPTTPDFEIDLPKFRENVRFSMKGVEGGLGCLMAAGGGGEGYFLNIPQWKSLIEAFAEETGDKVSTMAGVFELNAKHAIEKIKFAEELGIDLVQLAPPHYEKPTDLEVFNYYEMVNDAIDDMGIIVYHTYWSMPEDYEITLPLMRRITDLDRVVGIKWASTSLRNFTDVVFNLREKVSIIDNQGFVDMVKDAHGIRAFMCFIGNYAPVKTARLAGLFLDGRYEEWAQEKARALAHRSAIMREILSLVHGTVGKGEVCTLAEGTLSKTTMEIVGRPIGPPFPPQYELTPEQKADLKAKLEKDDLLSDLK